jgi:PEP-CTERM/exosortase A-associated glycosyltransferase
MPFARETVMMTALGRALGRLLSKESVDVIHVHSPVLCGLPAVLTARRRGIPVVYEVRGFWEDGFIHRWPRGERALRYRVSRGLETQVFHHADAVVAISQQMLNDIAERGIHAAKLRRAPNGVDPARFLPIGPDDEIIRRHQLDGGPVLGFIGSLYAFEGLECLLDAMLAVRERLPQARLLIVGGGEQERLLPERVAALGLGEQVHIVGRVPHKEVTRYYSVMDLLVYPRVRNRTTELTTPLKPLEAMAMGKAVVGSDVGGIRELLDNGRVGRIFEAGNSARLAECLVELLSDPSLRERVAADGRAYVLRDRAWQRIVLNYQDLYNALARGSVQAETNASVRSLH